MSDKYESLYNLAKEDFASEVDRLTRVDNKAFALLSVATLLFGSYIIGLKWIANEIFPPQSIVSFIILFLAILLLFGVARFWLSIFSVIKISTRQSIGVNSEMRAFYDKNSLATIHFAMAKRISEGTVYNRKVIASKVQGLSLALQGLKFSGICAFALILLAGVHALNSPESRQCETTITKQEMSECPKAKTEITKKTIQMIVEQTSRTEL